MLHSYSFKEEEGSSRGVRLQLAVKSKSGIDLYWGPPSYIKKIDSATRSGATNFQYNADGRFIAILNGTPEFPIEILNTESTETFCQITHPSTIQSCAFSPKGSFLLSWERPIQAKPIESSSQELSEETTDSQEKNNPNSNSNNNNNNNNNKNQDLSRRNLILWDVKDCHRVYSSIQKLFVSDLWPTLKWNSEETVCARLVTNEIQFFPRDSIGTAVRRLKLPDMTKFSISPTSSKGSFVIATFVKEKNGAPGFVRLYSYPQLENICSKSFYRAQEVDFLWNSKGTALLILTKTDVDQSGKSYYGETNLHFMQTDGKFDSNIPLKKEGPIYDCCWNSDGNEFVVVYGRMPAQTTIFDLKCNPIADLGSSSRNTAKWSPNGKVLCVAGFGNLQGYMDFWDTKKLKKIGSAQASCASYYEWSPDSQYMLTAILWQRLKVDNGFKIWRCDGSLVTEEKFNELYQVAWRPTPSSFYRNLVPSPKKMHAETKSMTQSSPSSTSTTATATATVIVTSSASEKTGKYVHPNAIGRTVNPIKNDASEETPVKYRKEPNIRDELPPGYILESKTSKKNKRRRGKKKNTEKNDQENKSEQEDQEERDENPTIIEEQVKKTDKQLIQTFSQSINSIEKPNDELDPINGEGQGNGDDSNKNESNVNDSGRKSKAIFKRLRQIEDLKEQQRKGKSLNASQLEKINLEDSLRKELETLSFSN